MPGYFLNIKSIFWTINEEIVKTTFTVSTEPVIIPDYKFSGSDTIYEYVFNKVIR